MRYLHDVIVNSIISLFSKINVNMVLERNFPQTLCIVVGTMKLVRRLFLTKNTPMILKAKFDIKLKVIMSPFISRLLLGQKSVASYWKMER